jgi:hypothetical protein
VALAQALREVPTRVGEQHDRTLPASARALLHVCLPFGIDEAIVHGANGDLAHAKTFERGCLVVVARKVLVVARRRESTRPAITHTNVVSSRAQRLQ